MISILIAPGILLLAGSQNTTLEGEDMAGANGRRSSVAGSRRSSMTGENNDSNKSQFDDIPIIWIIGKILDFNYKTVFC